MKILKIRLKNLNSLKGEWTIDFSDEAYSSDGLFLISGPTGTGKSTILDAICLALYGKTPRLRDINQSANNIMTRGCGECFSEVTFESNEKIYTAYWYQHRSHKKPDGALQPQQWKVYEIKTGGEKQSSDLLESTIKKTGKKLQEITGMDFTRFTRSIMLAQGGFAEFLNSSEDDKATILEKVTGSEIYSQISTAVFEKHKREEKKLDFIKQKMDNTELLAEEEKNKILNNLKILKNNVEILKNERDFYYKHLEIKKKIINLKNENEKLKINEETIKNEIEKQRDHFSRLEKALKAEKIRHTYEKLLSTQKQKNEWENELSDLKKQTNDILAKKNISENELHNLENKRKLFEQKEISENELIKKVRIKDVEINKIKDELNKIKNKIKENETKLKSYKVEAGNNKKQIKKHKTEQKTLEEAINKEKGNVNLQEILITLKATHTENTRETAEIKTNETTLKQMEEDSEIKLKKLNETKKELEENRKKIQKLSDQIITSELKLKELSKNGSENVLRDENKKLQSKLQKLTELKKHIETGKNKKNKIQDIQIKIAGLKNRKAALDGEISEKRKSIEIIEQLISEIRNNIQFTEIIKSLEEKRKNLEDGQPCPLCGSTEHPFTKGIKFEKEEDEQKARLEEKNKLLGREKNLLSELEKEQTEINTKLNFLNEQKENFENELQTIENEVHNLENQLNLKNSAAENTEKLISETKNQVEHIEEQIKNINSETTLLIEKQNQLGKLKTENSKLQILLKENETGVEKLKLQIKNLKEQNRSKQNSIENRINKINKLLKPAGLKYVSVKEGHTVLEKLEQRIQRINSGKEKIGKLEIEIQNLINRNALLEGKISETDNELNNLLVSSDAYEQNLNLLETERFKLYGQKNIKDEENKLVSERKKLEQQHKNISDSLNKAINEYTSLKARYETIQNNIQTAEKSLLQIKNQFDSELKNKEFQNREDFLLHRLPEEEITRITRLRKHLSEEAKRISDLLEKNNNELSELQKQESADGKEEIENHLKDSEEKIEELLKELGKENQKLSADEEMRKKYKEFSDEYMTQNNILKKWEKLNKIIGSKDGKKFRNIAQQLTLDILLKYADKHLKNMTDRYLLIRDETRKLSINVVDNYMAGEIRSTGNLSGGESFIVSLALALGLSEMSSENISINSLFLDEGFGTLDENSLEIVLEALSKLKMQNTLIGIISHVKLLKERIRTGITITSYGNGYGIPKGNGVSRAS